MAHAARITPQERAAVLNALTSALKNVSSLEVEGGVLAQAWMPDGEELRLHTKGLPFSLIGSGDLLALFRCLSCKFTFSTDLKKLPLMGSPGRVFSTGEAETSDNVQQCGVDIYLRNKEARACRIFSTIHLPVFNDITRRRPVAVLEITQFKGSTNSYQAVFDWSRMYLQAAGVYLPQHIETKTFEMRSHAMSIRFTRTHESAFGELFIAQQAVQSRERQVSQLEDITDPASPTNKRQILMTQEEAGGGNPSLASQKMQGELQSSGEASERDEEDLTGVSPPWGQTDAASPSSDTPYGKSMLSKQDLETHFAFSLSEAARKLGVSNTTVKRACRRYGIARWPRQEIMKAAAEKEAAARAAVMLEPVTTAASPLPEIPWNASFSQSLGSFDDLGSAAAVSQGHRLGSTSFIDPASLRQHLREGLQGEPRSTERLSSASKRWQMLQNQSEERAPLEGRSRSFHPPFLQVHEVQESTSQQPGYELTSSALEGEAQGMDMGDMSIEALSALHGGEGDPLSDWPSQWAMDLDDKHVADL